MFCGPFPLPPTHPLGLCIVSPLIYNFWLPLWYIHTFLNHDPGLLTSFYKVPDIYQVMDQAWCHICFLSCLLHTWRLYASLNGSVQFFKQSSVLDLPLLYVSLWYLTLLSVIFQLYHGSHFLINKVKTF